MSNDLQRARNAATFARHDLARAEKRGDLERAETIRESLKALNARVEEQEKKYAY